MFILITIKTDNTINVNFGLSGYGHWVHTPKIGFYIVNFFLFFSQKIRIPLSVSTIWPTQSLPLF